MLLTYDPSTWTRLELHPSFAEYRFGSDWESWYEGDDPVADLASLADCASNLVRSVPGIETSLVILDDLTVFVEISTPRKVGQFGIGRGDGLFYVDLDSDPDNETAAELQGDNLSNSQVAVAVGCLLSDSQ